MAENSFGTCKTTELPSASTQLMVENQLSKMSRGKSSESSVLTLSQIWVDSVTCGMEIVRNVDGYSHHEAKRRTDVISKLESGEKGHDEKRIDCSKKPGWVLFA